MAIDQLAYDLDEFETRQRLEREFQELMLWYEHEREAHDHAEHYCPECLVGTMEMVGSTRICTYCGHEAEAD